MDASEWDYRGEGGANLVLAYSSSSPPFIGKVARIQKTTNNNQSESTKNHNALSAEEELVWKEIEGIVSAPTKELASQLYVDRVFGKKQML